MTTRGTDAPEGLAIIIVTHNSAADILACLQAIERERASVSAEVFVVDAGSRDNTIELLLAVALPIQILRLRNVGFAAAANAGAVRVRAAFLLFVNPDAVVEPGSLRACVESFADLRVRVVGGVLQDRERVPEPLVGVPLPSLLRTIVRHVAPGRVQHCFPQLLEMSSGDAPLSIPWVSGGLLGVRRDEFRARGGFNEQFFLYFEDVDFCRRVRLHGGWVLLHSGVRAFHERGQSANAAARRRAYDFSQQRYFSLHRSRSEAMFLRLLRVPYRFAGVVLGILGICLPLAVLAASPHASLLLAVVIVLATLGVSRKPLVGILLLCLTLFLGQSVRLPFSLLGATATDAVLPFVLTGLILHVYGRGKFLLLLNNMAAVWWIPAALTPGLLLAFERLPENEWQAAFLYALRLGAALLLIPLLRCAGVSFRTTVRVLAGTAALLAVVGFLQYLFLPSLPPVRETILSQLLLGWSGGGWDPHTKRLFATWLDPNFLGGFFVVVLALLVARASSFLRREAGKRRELALIFGSMALLASALALTRSRSSFVAFGFLLCCMLFWKFGRRLLIPVATSVLAMLLLFPGITARLRDVSLADPTVQLRLVSFQQSFRHILAFPVFGAGYNAYGAEQLAAGHISALAIHSRGAADNAVLTMFATTGLWGTALLGGGVLATMRRMLERARQGDTAALGALLVLLTLSVHSQFLQSITYVHLLVPLALVFGSTDVEEKRA